MRSVKEHDDSMRAHWEVPERARRPVELGGVPKGVDCVFHDCAPDSHTTSHISVRRTGPDAAHDRRDHCRPLLRGMFSTMAFSSSTFLGIPGSCFKVVENTLCRFVAQRGGQICVSDLKDRVCLWQIVS